MRRTTRFVPLALALAALALGSGCRGDGDQPLAPSETPSYGAGFKASDFQQCEVGNPRNPSCSWVNSVLNATKNVYFEDDVVPQKLIIGGASITQDNTITIQWGVRKGINGNYDFLATYDNGTGPSNPCTDAGPGMAPFCTAGALSGAIDQEDWYPGGNIDPGGTLAAIGGGSAGVIQGAYNRYTALPGRTARLTLVNGTISSIGPLTYAKSGSDTSTVLATISFKFRANAGSGGNVLALWGPHVAFQGDWGAGRGAAGQSGAPFHVKLQSYQVNGGPVETVGSMALNMMGDVVQAFPSLSLSKSSTVDTVTAGDTVNYTVTVTNGGTGAASNVVITDSLPGNAGLDWFLSPAGTPAQCSISGSPGSEVLGCTFASLAAGASVSVTVKSLTTAATCGQISNTARATATGTTVSGSPAGPVTIQVNCPVVSITKTAANDTVSAGDTIRFTLTASNAGPGSATGVVVTDTVPTSGGLSWSIGGGTGAASCSIAGGVLTCNYGTMAAGTSLSVILKSATTGSSCGLVTNRGHVATSNDGSGSDTAQVQVLCGNVSITKVAANDTVSAGDTIRFTLTASNAGPGSATGVVVTDTVPTSGGLGWSIAGGTGAGSCSIASGVLTCNYGTMAAGTSLSVILKSATTGSSCGLVTNRGHVATSNNGSGSDTAQVQVLCANLALAKVAADDTVSAGDTIRFTLTTSNSGPGTAQGVVVTDTVPTNGGLSWSIGGGTGAGNCSIAGGVLTCSYGTMAAGTSLSVILKSATTGATCGLVTNRGHAVASNDGSASDTATVRVQCPNLAIVKTPDGDTIAAGDTARFTIRVRNTGPGDASSVVLTDTLPNSLLTWSVQGTTGSPTCGISGRILGCTRATLAAGDSFTVTVRAVVPANYILQPPSPAGTPIEIDGDLADGAAAGKDWATLGLNCLSIPPAGCKLDQPTGGTDNSFGQGTKEDTPVPTVVTGSIPNNKSDLLRFYVANERFVTTDFLYLAWERVQAPNGTTNMDFELNQSTQLSGNGITPVRTAGDLLIKFDLARGGTSPTLGFHRWVTAASAGGQTPAQACEAANSFPCWGKLTALGANVAAAINTGSVIDPIAPDAPRTLDALTFGEARINLQATGIFQPGVCVNFGRAYLKSRSSDAFSSEIKDFIAPVPVSVSNCAPATLDNRAWSVAAFATAVSDTGRIVVTETGPSAALFFAAPPSGLRAPTDAGRPLPFGTVRSAMATLGRSEAAEARPARTAATVAAAMDPRAESARTRGRAGPPQAPGGELPGSSPPAARGGGVTGDVGDA